eukprot:CAMPEP_0172478874 /NCGR_PEP_ID=MMETSP1066-20121228/3110_1 /TAXON_ID=671091 /ORGANISM="Coscinodiscus wailesii, Strain CCMP2513" /LENGTH=475 /DNA_ID=CAMNT_0013238801 /DNA_START=56 /DNA_END=1483 /DNA_ORIENTATION=-
MMRNNINGAGGGRTVVPSIDFYRRVPKDLTESTFLGAVMSILCVFIMTVLFISETWAFARSTIASTVAIDESIQPQIRLNFNITFMDLHCDYVSVDVLDSLGTNRQNVTKNVEKWQLDDEGRRRIYSGRNREQRELVHEEHDETLEELHEDGVHVTSLTQKEFTPFVKKHELTFVNYFAPWCIWCQRLHPTWEKFAEAVEEAGMPLKVVNVDCVAEGQLCRDQRVMAFPTIRWYRNGVAVPPDYNMDRTVAALTGYAQRKIDLDERFRGWKDDNDKGSAAQYERMTKGRPEHPGCQVSGHLMVNRVPGNFHIEAKSKSHNLNAAMTNLTHRVNHLSFGEDINMKSRKHNRILKQTPAEYKQFNPIDGNMYSTQKFHEAYHHYIKVVSTHLDYGSDYNRLETYQMLEQSQIVYYDEMNVPEARFSYDISPMSVVVTKEGRKWYDYVTSVCAIIGGTFTTLGLIDASLYKMFKSKKL